MNKTYDLFLKYANNNYKRNLTWLDIIQTVPHMDRSIETFGIIKHQTLTPTSCNKEFIH